MDTTFTIHIDTGLKAALKSKLAGEQRTLKNWLEEQATKYVNEKEKDDEKNSA